MSQTTPPPAPAPAPVAPATALSGEESIPAATVVIFRHAPQGGPPELLMATRGTDMRFAGGALVFPGGRIDPVDRELARTLAGLPALAADADHDLADEALNDAAARIAGIRETLEETGLVIGLDRPVSAAEATRARRLLLDEGAMAPMLAAMGWGLAPDLLVPFARWWPRRPKTFDTRFYLADLGSGQVDISVDGTEFTTMFWLSATEALRRADSGELSIIFPTRMNLERLAQFASFAAARAHAETTPIGIVTARLEDRDGEQWLVIPDGLGYPVRGQPMATVKRGF